MADCTRLTRQQFLKQTALGDAALTGMGGILYSRQAPALISSDSARPNASWGLQIGDVAGDRDHLEPLGQARATDCRLGAG